MAPDFVSLDFMPLDFVPIDSILRDLMLPDFALSILVRPEVMTRLTDLCFGKLISQSNSRLRFQHAVRRKAEFPQPHKNDRAAAPVPADCAKTAVSILLRRVTATIAEPRTGAEQENGIDMQPWNTAHATIYGVAIGLVAAAVKLAAPWSEPHGSAVAMIQEFVGAGLAFGLLCGLAAAFRNFVARRLI
jgi:hypothetical protein